MSHESGSELNTHGGHSERKTSIKTRGKVAPLPGSSEPEIHVSIALLYSSVPFLSRVGLVHTQQQS